MYYGFIANAAEVLGVTSASYSAVELSGDTTIDANAGVLPQSFILSDVEIVLDETVAGTTALTCWLSWDADGDDVIASPVTVSTVAGQTDTSLRMAAVTLESFRRASKQQSTIGSIYLWVAVDAGTCTVKRVRAHWRSGNSQ